VTKPYAMTRLDALRQLRREGYAVVDKDSWRLRSDFGVVPVDDPRCKHEFPLPGWMSPDQEDPCRCDLPTGHEGAHSCEHLRKSGQPVATNSGRSESDG